MLATRSVASNPIVRYVADALRFYMEFHARYDGFYGAFIHDPLAVAAALDRSLVDDRGALRRRRDDRRDHGRETVADRRRLTGQGPEPRRRGRARTSRRSSSGSSNASGGWRRTAPAWHASAGQGAAGGRRPPGRRAHHHELGSIRHPDDRAHPDRDRDQHRARPDRGGGPEGADLPRFDRDDPRRRPGRTDPRPRHRACSPTWSGRTSCPRPFHSDFAAPFAVVAAWIGFLAGLVAQFGFFRSRPNSSWGQVALARDRGPARRWAGSGSTASCRSTRTGRSRSSATRPTASPFFVVAGLCRRDRRSSPPSSA